MATEVLVPPLGQTVDTLTLVSWYRSEGDAVQQGEPLYVLETDKATLDIEAPATGILRRVTALPGDEVKALSAIAVIAAVGEIEQRIKTDKQMESAPPSVPSVPASLLARPRLFVSPRARLLAEGVPLADVKATGPEGAIVERDVRAYLAQREGGTVSDMSSRAEATAPIITPVARRMAEEAGLDWRALTGSGPRGQITREDVARAGRQRMEMDKRMGAGEPGSRGAGEQRGAEAPSIPAAPSSFQLPASSFQLPASILPLSGVRAVIAERMAASHSQTAPVTLTAEADATALVELRRQLAADGVNVSYNALFLQVLARALRKHPQLNATLEGETIKLWRRIDIGVAVDAEHGLLAPVVRDVDRKGLAQLTEEMADLAERARSGQCSPDELRGSTFTLTNLGMFGIDAFTPLINLPECAILGVGRIKTQPVWMDGQVVGREMVWLSLTFDHRLVDGGPAARFLQRVVQLVEKPHLLMA